MASQALSAKNSGIGDLYARLIAAWNRRDARQFAGCFAPGGSAVGFDGTQMEGASQIEASIQEVFDHHPTARYVTIVREERNVGDDVVLLRAVAGMVPPGASQIKPDVNAIQSLVTQRVGTEWKIALFQNTPAAFHGRPQASEALTEELQHAYDRQQIKQTVRAHREPTD